MSPGGPSQVQGKGLGQRGTPLGHLFGEVWNLTECSKERGACQGCGLGPQIPGELGVGEGGGHSVIEDCPGDHQEASFCSAGSQGCSQNQDLKKQSPLAHAGILLNQQAGRTTNEPRNLSLQLGPGSKRGLLRPSSPTLLRASLLTGPSFLIHQQLPSSSPHCSQRRVVTLQELCPSLVQGPSVAPFSPDWSTCPNKAPKAHRFRHQPPYPFIETSCQAGGMPFLTTPSTSYPLHNF